MNHYDDAIISCETYRVVKYESMKGNSFGIDVILRKGNTNSTLSIYVPNSEFVNYPLGHEFYVILRTGSVSIEPVYPLPPDPNIKGYMKVERVK